MALNKIDARRLTALAKVIDKGDPSFHGDSTRAFIPIGRPVGVIAYGREWIYGVNSYSVSGFIPTDETIHLPGWQAARDNADGARIQVFELSQAGDLAGECDAPRMREFLLGNDAFVSTGDGDEWEAARRRFQVFAAGAGVSTLCYPTRGIQDGAIVDMRNGRIEVIPPVQKLTGRGAVAAVDSPLALSYEWADGTTLRLAAKRIDLAAGFVGSGGALTAYGLGTDGHSATPEKRLAVFHSPGGREFSAVMQLRRPTVSAA